MIDSKEYPTFPMDKIFLPYVAPDLLKIQLIYDLLTDLTVEPFE
jgi:hypothetical protein